MSAEVRSRVAVVSAGSTDHFSWFRMYHDVPTAIPLRELSDFDFRVLVVCHSFASRAPSGDRLDGALTVSPTGVPLPLKFIAEGASGDVAATEAAIERLLERGLLELREEDGALRLAYGWKQYASDSSTGRTRKHRRETSGGTQKVTGSLPKQTEQTRQTKRNVPANVSGADDDDALPPGQWEDPLTGEIKW